MLPLQQWYPGQQWTYMCHRRKSVGKLSQFESLFWLNQGQQNLETSEDKKDSKDKLNVFLLIR